MAAAKKQQRVPNTQPNHLPATLNVTINQHGKAIGLVEMPQVENLSAAGNRWYFAAIKQGWHLFDNPETAIEGLGFELLGSTFKLSESGVHLSAPRVSRAGVVVPNSGGNLCVTHTAVVDVPTTDGPKPFTVMATVTYLGEEKAFALNLKGLPRVNQPKAAQVVGVFSGLTIAERA